MRNKVLLLIDEADRDTVLRLIYNHNHITVETIFNNGKSDAEAYVSEKLEAQAIAYENKLADVTEMYENKVEEVKKEVVEEIINTIDMAEVYLKTSANMFSSEVIGVCKDFKEDIVKQLKAKYIGERDGK